MKDFLLKVFTAGSGISSKRVIGAVCYFMLTISIIVLSFIKPDFPDISSIINTLIITAASLLGITTVEKFGSLLKREKDNRD